MRHGRVSPTLLFFKYQPTDCILVLDSLASGRIPTYRPSPPLLASLVATVSSSASPHHFISSRTSFFSYMLSMIITVLYKKLQTCDIVDI
ncbi:hypothetical protein QN277_015001 [Acacia crassicarpa]|uniref:Uncharacterized protein n=1 Tax=Acacia crassicarpa TaxID=499986 RepID=A0AAE1KLD0_9FABA|nr:hypothetical protein QN277_015001 [Acacia crassicarpa]